MRLSLLGGQGESIFDTNGASRTINGYGSTDEQGEHNKIIRSCPGDKASRSTGLASADECKGGLSAGNITHFAYKDNDLLISHAGGVYTKYTATTGDYGDYANLVGGTSSGNNQILVVGQSGDAFVYNGTAGDREYFELTDTVLKTSTPSAVAANTLTDTVGTSFVTAGVLVGMYANNVTNGTYSRINDVTATVLTLDDDIFDDTADTYNLQSGYGAGLSGSFNGTTCTHIDGYFVRHTNNLFYISAINNACIWNALDFATAGYNVDKITAVHAHKGNLWIIGERSTEIWYNSGNADFPFQSMQSGYSNIGTNYPNSLSISGDEFSMLATNGSGMNSVVTTEGLSYRRIDTFNINKAIFSPWITTEDIFGFSYSEDGHGFYCLQLRKLYDEALLNTCLVYDVTTGEWHEWETDINAIATFWHSGTGETRHMAGKTAGSGDFIYELIEGSLQSGTAKDLTRIPATIHAEGNSNVFHSVQLDVGTVNSLLETVDATKADDYRVYDVTDMGIVLNVDKLYLPKIDLLTPTISAVSGKRFTFSSAHNIPATVYGTWNEYYVVDGVTGLKKFPLITAKLRWKDENKKWTSYKTRTQTVESDRLIWRKLGRSRKRQFEIVLTEQMSKAILGAYAEITLNQDGV